MKPKNIAPLFACALAATSIACSKPAELSLGSAGGNAMAYDTTTLTVKAGQKVHLKFKNNAAPPVAGSAPMDHNWVLVKPGTEASVATAGQQAGASAGYIPLVSDVIASTSQSAPGQVVEVTFSAPDSPGNYPYICTNPGHYMTMKGTLIVN